MEVLELNNFYNDLKIIDKLIEVNEKKCNNWQISSCDAIRKNELLNGRKENIYNKLKIIDDIFQMGYNFNTAIECFKNYYPKTRDFKKVINTLDIKYFECFGIESYFSAQSLQSHHR
jgi:hypothetical protein